jgi:Fe-coproporphyrin III synthase
MTYFLINKYSSANKFNYLKGYFESPSIDKIHCINFAVTYKCNSRCVMCDIWKKYKNDSTLRDREIGYDVLKGFLTRSKLLKKIWDIRFTGGEPFLRDDFVDVFGLFFATFPHSTFSIASNGLDYNLIEKNISEILDNYKIDTLSVSFSLDGLGKMHDSVRGIPGSFDHIINTAKTLKAEFNSRLNLSFNFTILPLNYQHLYQVYDYSKKLGVGFGSVFADVSENYYSNDNKKFDWTLEQLNEVETMINRIIIDDQKDKKFFHRLFGTYAYYSSHSLLHQKIKSRIFRCYSGTHSFFLDPYGDIYPCIMLSKKLGNICDQSFDDLWTSMTASDIRSSIREEDCSCWTSCEVSPSLRRDFNTIFWNIKNLIITRKFK